LFLVWNLGGNDKFMLFADCRVNKYVERATCVYYKTDQGEQMADDTHTHTHTHPSGPVY